LPEIHQAPTHDAVEGRQRTLLNHPETTRTKA
jgi:hypothetical protein